MLYQKSKQSKLTKVEAPVKTNVNQHPEIWRLSRVRNAGTIWKSGIETCHWSPQMSTRLWKFGFSFSMKCKRAGISSFRWVSFR